MAEPVFLLDSNICIYILRDAQSVSALRVQEQAVGSVVTSAIVYAEVMRGLALASRPERDKAERLFYQIEVLPFDHEAAAAYGDVPFKRGQFDRLIAAHALAKGLIVVTSNVDDFSDVAGLRVEDWSK